jgi:hypothetical protein
MHFFSNYPWQSMENRISQSISAILERPARLGRRSFLRFSREGKEFCTESCHISCWHWSLDSNFMKWREWSCRQVWPLILSRDLSSARTVLSSNATDCEPDTDSGSFTVEEDKSSPIPRWCGQRNGQSNKQDFRLMSRYHWMKIPNKYPFAMGSHSEDW